MKKLIVCFAFILSTQVWADGYPTFAAFEISLQANQSLPLGKKLSFQVTLKDPEGAVHMLNNWQEIDAAVLSSDTMQVTMTSHYQNVDPISPKDLNESFVVDLGEASTKSFLEGFTKSESDDIDLNQVTEYVNQFIEAPTYIHGFNIASQAAKKKSGDCTEYAVLTTALARHLKLPARVIIGTVIIEEESQLMAFGHAWTEVWYNESWHNLDAALYQMDTVQRFYLPASKLENEGPGYAWGMAKIATFLPISITQVRTL